MASVFHPAIDPWLVIGVRLAEVAGRKARRTISGLRARRRGGGAYRVRSPGRETPMWNVLAAQLRKALRPYGAKARFARFLGIPRQRLYDYLKKTSRLPDAELALQMLTWLAQKNAGRDISL